MTSDAYQLIVELLGELVVGLGDGGDGFLVFDLHDG